MVSKSDPRPGTEVSHVLFRRLLLVCHRWVGLCIAGFLIMAGLTGAVISWDHEIDDLLNAHLLTAPPAPGDAAAAQRMAFDLARRAETADPRARVTYLPLEPEKGASLALFLEPRIDPATREPFDLGYNQLFFDPASGQELGRREWGKAALTRENFVPFLYALHYSLHVPAFWGSDRWGIWLMGGIALLWTLDCFVGFYLTLPSRTRRIEAEAAAAMAAAAPVAARRESGWWTRWKPAWQVKWRSSGRRITFDLHRATGLWLWAFLFVLALSGMSLNLYTEVAQPLVSAVSSFTPSPYDTREMRPLDQPIEPRQTMAQIAARAAEEGTRRGWTEPVGALSYAPLYGVYAAFFFHPGGDHGAAGVGPPQLYFDSEDGRYLGERIPWKGSAGDLFLQIQFPLHSGRIAGLPGRIFISCMGLLVALLSTTGVVIWWQKRSASSLVARRVRRHANATPAMTPVTPVTPSPRASSARTTTMLLVLLGVCGLSMPGRAWAQAAAPAAPAAAAAPSSRQLTGVVQDEQGGRLPGAVVVARSRAVTREATTDADGAFTLRLPPGRYTLRVESQGFETSTQETEIAAGQDARITVSLKVPPITDAVTVRAPDIPRNVSASRIDTPLIETPQSISVITQEQIQAQGAQTMQDVLRYTVGVRAEMYGVDNRGDWFTLRGGSEGSTVLDGLRLPLSGWWGNVRNEPYAFDRVEVLRGPSSAMFGQNGPGGIINLVSKLPQNQPRQEIQLQFGNYQHKQIAADLTGPVGRHTQLQYRLVTLVKDSDTQVDYADEQRQYVAPSIAWRPDRRTALTVYSQYQRDRSKNNVGFFPWEGMLLPAPNGRIPIDTFIGEPDWDTYGGNRTRVGNQFDYRINDTWHLRQDFRYDQVRGNLEAMYASFFEGPGRLLEDGRSVNRVWYTSKSNARIANAAVFVDGTFETGRIRHTLLLGVDGIWQRDVIQDLEGDATPLDVYTPTYGTFPRPVLDYGAAAPIRTTQAGVVVQDQMKVADRLSIVAGLRRSYAKSEVDDAPDAGSDDGAWTGRFGLVYLAPGGWSPYASYSNSFEAVAGRKADGAPFEPKRGEQIEGGVKWAPAQESVLITAAAYNLVENNRLTIDPQNPLNQVQQGEVTIKGFELEARTNRRAWNVIASYTYTDAKTTGSSDPEDIYLGKQLFSIPRHSTAAWVMHNFTTRGMFDMTGGLGVRYVGETTDGVDILRTPSNTLADAVFSIARGSWKYAINATNLFDKQYIATCLERGDCWYGSRRRVIGTLTFRH